MSYKEERRNQKIFTIKEQLVPQNNKRDLNANLPKLSSALERICDPELKKEVYKYSDMIFEKILSRKIKELPKAEFDGIYKNTEFLMSAPEIKSILNQTVSIGIDYIQMREETWNQTIQEYGAELINESDIESDLSDEDLEEIGLKKRDHTA